MEGIVTHPAVIPFLGFAVGLIGTLIGVGGGFFIVPYLILAHGFDPRLASGTSLWLVTINAVSATARKMRQPGTIDYTLGATLAAFTIPGAIIGPQLVQWVRADAYHVSLGVLHILVAIYAAFGIGRGGEGAPAREVRGKYLIAALASLGTGFISSMFGVGGGLVHVPLMMFVFGMAASNSTATSQFCLMWTALVGALTFTIRFGQVDWTQVGLFAPGVVVGAVVGAWASRRVRATVVRRVLAVVCVVVAVELFVKAFHLGG